MYDPNYDDYRYECRCISTSPSIEASDPYYFNLSEYILKNGLEIYYKPKHSKNIEFNKNTHIVIISYYCS